ncbi:MAG TPA: hypothetical protein ENK27_02195 [Desulfobulbus sp.]|nr:hypothetical protein [Desulfobulbus sp.]
MTDQQTRQQQIKVRYSETSATFASQFIVNINGDELILNCSPGPLADPSSGESILPVDCRIGMTMSAARRLHDVLTRVLTQQGSAGKDVPPGGGSTGNVQQ